jgi:hypothetical protein
VLRLPALTSGSIANGGVIFTREMEQQITALVDPIYRDKVLRAREAPASRKMGWGAELFYEVCGRMRSGIRMQFPDAADSEVDAILKQRLERLTKVEDAGRIEPIEPIAK